MFVGVDGHAHGWVAVVIDAQGFVGAGSFAGFDALIEAYRKATIIGVDIPIGLVEDGNREADRAARAFVQGQRLVGLQRARTGGAGRRQLRGGQRDLAAGERQGAVAAVVRADTVPVDDVVDAAGAAWTARRIAGKAARRFPPGRGRAPAIWA